MKVFAYARVSAQDQSLARQIDEFLAFGVPPARIYSDKKSGKDFSRSAYKRLLQRLKKNDLLVIKSIDRLGRNYDAIIREWNTITNKIGADILVLDMPILDTRTKSDNLMGKFISDIVLQILSFVAENERNDIRRRQREGILSAKARGVKFGRPHTQYTPEFLETARLYAEKRISPSEAVCRSGFKRCSFYYHVKQALRTTPL